MLGGCSGPFSTLDPAGPAAGHVATLWWAMLAGSAVLAALVMGLLAMAFFRRERRPQGRGAALWLGWLGVAMPSAVLLVLLGYALVLGERAIAHRVPGVIVLEATGRQWHWEFRHPGADGPIVTRDVMHIPAGRPIDVRIASLDVIHGFWVPRLAGKMDAIPGHVNVLRIQAAQPGVFEGQCAEFCGLEHAAHRFRVIAHDAAGWAAFQRGGPP